MTGQQPRQEPADRSPEQTKTKAEGMIPMIPQSPPERRADLLEGLQRLTTLLAKPDVPLPAAVFPIRVKWHSSLTEAYDLIPVIRRLPNYRQQIGFDGELDVTANLGGGLYLEFTLPGSLITQRMHPSGRVFFTTPLGVIGDDEVEAVPA